MAAMSRRRALVAIAAALAGAAVVFGVTLGIGHVVLRFLDENLFANAEIVDLDDLASFPASFEVLAEGYFDCGPSERQGFLFHDYAVRVDSAHDPVAALTGWLTEQGFVAQPEDGLVGSGRPFRLLDDHDGDPLPPGGIGAKLWVPGDPPIRPHILPPVSALVTEPGEIALRLWPITPCAI